MTNGQFVEEIAIAVMCIVSLAAAVLLIVMGLPALGAIFMDWVQRGKPAAPPDGPAIAPSDSPEVSFLKGQLKIVTDSSERLQGDNSHLRVLLDQSIRENTRLRTDIAMLHIELAARQSNVTPAQQPTGVNRNLEL